MPVHIITGNLGAGKTLVSVGRIRDALLAGRPVATNLDLRLEVLVPGLTTAVVTRLPDHPSSADMHALGIANRSRDEKRNGLIVIDEAGAWLNARGWQDKDREALIWWMLRLRRYGWDLILVVQDISLLDKQIRVTVCEHLVRCRRLDRFGVPFIGPIVALFASTLRLPQVHIANVFYGTGPGSPCVERWFYRGRDLWQAYETRQMFNGENIATASMLSPGKYAWLRPSKWYRFSHRSAVQSWLQRLVERFAPINPFDILYRYFRLMELHPELRRDDDTKTWSEFAAALWQCGTCRILQL